MATQSKGKLIIIGGSEDKDGDRDILKEVVKLAGRGKLIVVTVATQEPEALAEEYRQLFKEMGCANVATLDIRTREDAHDRERIDLIKQAKVVFFTGGDQLRISSQMGGTPILSQMHALYQSGTTIVGTSAGAAIMPATMLVSGESESSVNASALGMAPGLGFLEDAVIDSHFAERGRIGRLVGAVAQNPSHLGIGIDEDTAIIVDRHRRFRVRGSGAVYVLDGQQISYSSLSESRSEEVLSVFDLLLHVLGDGDQFDLSKKVPLAKDGG